MTDRAVQPDTPIHEAVTLDPPYPAYWRQVLTDTIYDAIHHPPGGPKNVPSGQIAEAVVARLLRAASQERPSIDVERLARALKAVRRQQDNAEGRRKGYSDNYFDPEAEAIAAEYLRLSGPVGVGWPRASLGGREASAGRGRLSTDTRGDER